MFTIGDFGRHGRVSVRMLRHYDALGLLQPARVDESTGYRYYRADQLGRLNRLIALKDLGFTLTQVAAILTDEVDTDELRGMLRLRRAELQEQIATDSSRLARVEARLRSIESEEIMLDNVVVKAVPGVTVAVLTGVAEDFGPEAISPVIGPLYEQLGKALADSGIEITGYPVAWYEDRPDGIGVNAGFPVDVTTVAGEGFSVVDLPGLENAATTVHHGSMDGIVPTVQGLARWIEGNGWTSTGYSREVYLHCPEDRSEWLTEIQEPVMPV